jgi:small subunit ribosomal protein S2
MSDESKSYKKVLDASGVKYGEAKKKWNPKMGEYVVSTIVEDKTKQFLTINTAKTAELLESACHLIKDTILEGKQVLFVGTKDVVKTIILEVAVKTGQFYVDQRWLGGT